MGRCVIYVRSHISSEFLFLKRSFISNAFETREMEDGTYTSSSVLTSSVSKHFTLTLFCQNLMMFVAKNKFSPLCHSVYGTNKSRITWFLGDTSVSVFLRHTPRVFCKFYSWKSVYRQRIFTSLTML